MGLLGVLSVQMFLERHSRAYYDVRSIEPEDPRGPN